MMLAPRATEVWPVDRLLALCLGWQAGETIAALAARLQANKNTILGRVHRLAEKGILVARPSPIRALTQGKQRRRAPVPAATLPPLASAPEPPPAPPPRPLAPPSPRPHGRITECCWPFGRPGTRAFHFCAAPTEPGRPYCGVHARIAFVRPGHRPDGDPRPAP